MMRKRRVSISKTDKLSLSFEMLLKELVETGGKSIVSSIIPVGFSLVEATTVATPTCAHKALRRCRLRGPQVAILQKGGLDASGLGNLLSRSAWKNYAEQDYFELDLYVSKDGFPVAIAHPDFPQFSHFVGNIAVTTEEMKKLNETRKMSPDVMGRISSLKQQFKSLFPLVKLPDESHTLFDNLVVMVMKREGESERGLQYGQPASPYYVCSASPITIDAIMAEIGEGDQWHVILREPSTYNPVHFQPTYQREQKEGYAAYRDTAHSEDFTSTLTMLKTVSTYSEKISIHEDAAGTGLWTLLARMYYKLEHNAPCPHSFVLTELNPFSRAMLSFNLSMLGLDDSVKPIDVSEKSEINPDLVLANSPCCPSVDVTDYELVSKQGLYDGGRNGLLFFLDMMTRLLSLPNTEFVLWNHASEFNDIHFLLRSLPNIEGEVIQEQDMGNLSGFGFPLTYLGKTTAVVALKDQPLDLGLLTADNPMYQGRELSRDEAHQLFFFLLYSGQLKIDGHNEAFEAKLISLLDPTNRRLLNTSLPIIIECMIKKQIEVPEAFLEGLEQLAFPDTFHLLDGGQRSQVYKYQECLATLALNTAYQDRWLGLIKNRQVSSGTLHVSTTLSPFSTWSEPMTVETYLSCTTRFSDKVDRIKGAFLLDDADLYDGPVDKLFRFKEGPYSLSAVEYNGAPVVDPDDAFEIKFEVNTIDSNVFDKDDLFS